MNKFFFLIICVAAISCNTTSKHLRLPEPVTNHSTVFLKSNKRPMLYTFYGLDSSKQWSGIHTKVFAVNVKTGVSEKIGEVPDSFGRLASAASVIRNKIYVAGGYTVFKDGTEKSSQQIFEFDPQKNSFTKIVPLLYPIDDQAQAVWRDSLLFVISGWSDSINVNFVQVFNPVTNHWKEASPLPNDIHAKLFGGCAVIVGDTIYYTGGAMFTKNYPPNHHFWKGAINPASPYEIKWIDAGEHPGPFRYRAGMFATAEKVYIAGGSNETYNYNGISYKEKKPVEPNANMLVYEIKTGKFSIVPFTNPVMDIRSVVSIGKKRWAIAGGMTAGQKVVNGIRVIKIKNQKK